MKTFIKLGKKFHTKGNTNENIRTDWALYEHKSLHVTVSGTTNNLAKDTEQLFNSNVTSVGMRTSYRM